MIILEDVSTSKETINKIINNVKDKFSKSNYNFDDTVDNINFWCQNDKEHTVYIQDDESYATLCENDFSTEDVETLVDSVKYQLDNT